MLTECNICKEDFLKAQAMKLDHSGDLVVCRTCAEILVDDLMNALNDE